MSVLYYTSTLLTHMFRLDVLAYSPKKLTHTPYMIHHIHGQIKVGLVLLQPESDTLSDVTEAFEFTAHRHTYIHM